MLALNIEFIEQRWIPALRSKRYQQGKNRLLTIAEGGEKTYCCLGVACDLVKDEFGYRWVKTRGGVMRLVNSRYDVGMSLPEDVAAFIGITADGLMAADPEVAYEDARRRTALVILNDDEQYTFEQIAAFLEAVVKVFKETGVSALAQYHRRDRWDRWERTVCDRVSPA